MAVFYSFHYERDSWRVQQVMRMGVVEGQPLLNSQQWEAVKRRGDAAIQAWIDKEMAYKTAVVVLAGSQTAHRPWVQYEIARAWDNRKPLVGIRIHGLADALGHTDAAGPNPFGQVSLRGGGSVSDHVTLHDPVGWSSQTVYADIKRNLKTWVANAKKRS